MPTLRENPYGAFNFLVALGGEQGDGADAMIVGGFSDVSGLGIEVNYSEYRNGNEKVNTVRKIPNTYKVDDVTLKRGLIGSTDLFELDQGACATAHPEPRSVTITLLDEARNAVATWRLTNAQPKKWSRADAGRQGRRRGGDGGAPPRPRGHRVRVTALPPSRARRLGAPGVYARARTRRCAR